jgi:hypothetical protein
MSRRISLSPAEDRPRFNDIVASALRLRNSIPLELALVVLAFASHWAAIPLHESCLPLSTTNQRW